jgi:hypothetical protein
MGERQYRAESYCQIWVFEDQATYTYRNMVYERDLLEARKKNEDNPQIFFFVGGERRKPGPSQGAVQLVMSRAPVGEEEALPKYPKAHIQMDLGIVPGAQESTAMPNWFQDDKNCSDERGLPGGEHRCQEYWSVLSQ